MHSDSLVPGLVALHSNRAENLMDTLSAWLARTPLPPLSPEVVLVQSNGMAEWVKIALSQAHGVCAAAQVMLPSRFVWKTYRQVLGPYAVPAQSPLDKLPLTWRLTGLLQGALDGPDMAPLRRYLQPGDDSRRWQLAGQLADLYDQYQVYRSDWLSDWAQGRWVCRQVGGEQALSAEQRWQAALWQSIMLSLGPEAQHSSRAHLHQKVVDHLLAGHPTAQPLPLRVSVFGMSHMPQSLLSLLHALSLRCQVVLAVPNPCRFYWGDILDGRQIWQGLQSRQRDKGQALGLIPLEDMHLHAPSLLAAWGRQGRDFVRMLDAYDTARDAHALPQWPTLDVFDESPLEPGVSMLHQLQRRIRDLVPSHASEPALPLPANDPSVQFRSAHSPVRELEVLHDQLLLWRQGLGAQPLQARDVVVMVPDIERMAAAIDAVFGQYPRNDPRHIPYSIADLGATVRSPLIQAVQWLLDLPQSRAGLSEWYGLLQVPAVMRRLDLSADDLPQLMRWMADSGMRWGLHAEHRTGLGLAACGDTNTVAFGMQRMLMGYACGPDPVPSDAAPVPLGEVAGLAADSAGALALWIEDLQWWCKQAQEPACMDVWAERFRQMLSRAFQAESQADRQALQALEDALQACLQAVDSAQFAQPVPLELARDAWMQALQMPRLEQRFRGKGVTFCTLMPMRAIPFRVVCLLGMNEADYPRRAPVQDFDLMAQAALSRPGDRSRREDDRQLMLEALMSAREALYISWCGRSVRDDTEQPPSVLVAQLRDEIDLLWGPGTAESLTQSHPLQPFSRRYFSIDSPLRTHVREWQALAHTPSGLDATRVPDVLPPVCQPQGPPAALNLDTLGRWLRRPVDQFLRQRLQVQLERPRAWTCDEESFAIDPLNRHQWMLSALQELPRDLPPSALEDWSKATVQRWQSRGDLPLGGAGQWHANALTQQLSQWLGHVQAQRAHLGLVPQRLPVELERPGLVMQDLLSGAYVGADTEPPIWLMATPSRLQQSRGKRHLPLAAEKLVQAFLVSLASSAMGQPWQVVVVGSDAVVQSPVWPIQTARAELETLMDLWQVGQCTPLPLEPRAALHWLAQPDAHDALREAYEGNANEGEGWVRQDPALYRFYPTLDDLLGDGQFESWAARVYGALRAWAGQCQVMPHETPA